MRLFQLLVTLTCAIPATAQTTSGVIAGTIQATGSAGVSATPDQAQFTVSVVTQATTAQDAGTQNASQTTALIAALKSALAGNGNVQTVGYSITPRYNSGGTQIVGYTATNTVQMTDYNMSNIGSLIDVANANGGSAVSGISFGLQNPDPYVQQALSLAAKQAQTHAGSIASGLGTTAGAVVSAQEGTTYTPVVVTATPGAAASTPVITGNVLVTAAVTVTVRLGQ